MRTDAGMLRGTERFVELLRARLPRGVDNGWIQRCVSILDMVGGPQNAAAYMAVLRGLRLLLGWGYRSGWLKQLPHWDFFYQVYRMCGWARSRRTGLPDLGDEAPALFATPDYTVLFSGNTNYGRAIDAVILMTLIAHGHGPQGIRASQSHADEIARIVTVAGWRLRQHLTGRFFCSTHPSPQRLCTLWRETPESADWDLPAGTRDALAAGADMLHGLLAALPPKAVKHEAAPRPAAKVTRKHRPRTKRGRPVHFLPDSSELFCLPIRRKPSDGHRQPEETERTALILVSKDEINDAIRRDVVDERDAGDTARPQPIVATKEQIRLHVTARRRSQIDWSLVPSRPNALLLAEARPVVAELLDDARKAMATGDTVRLGTNLLLLLGAVTTLTRRQMCQLRYASLPLALERSDGTVITPDGYLVRTVPMPSERYRPAPGTSGLCEVGQRVVLRLPQEIQEVLGAWASSHALDAENGRTLLFPAHALPERALSRRGDAIRARTGVPRFSEARLANTLPLLLMTATQDLALMQMVTGDAQGLSAVGCAYYSPTMAMLQAPFDDAIRAWGLTPSPVSEHISVLRAGSKLCLTDTVMRARVAHLRHGLNYLARAMHRHDAQALIDNHNRMALYTGWLLHACLATRFYSTIGEMLLSDVALDPGWLVVGDKRSDPAHEARQLVVPPLAVAQIKAMASHLATLSQHERIPPTVRCQMRDALEGKKPFVFFTEGDAAVAWGREALRRHDPTWVWPSNALRHRAATQLRIHGCPGDFVAAQLGHVESGQVLGLDSPTDPLRFHAEVSKASEAYASTDGWSLQKGYGTGQWEPHVDVPLPSALTSLRKALEHQEKRYLRGTSPSGKPKDPGEARVEEDAIEALLLSRIATAFGGDATTPHLDGGFTRELRIAVSLRSAGDPVRAEWSLAVLRRLMLRGEAQAKWTCGDRRKVYHALVEPSPVAVGVIPPYRMYRAIRAWYIASLPSGVDEKPGVTLWCWLALGLVLEDFVTHRQDLLSTLDGLPEAQQVHARRDALMIPLRPTSARPAQVTFLCGPLALLAVRCRTQGGAWPQGDEAWAMLEAWLGNTLPPEWRPRGASVLPWLLDVTRLASRLELPGLARAARAHIFSATSLPLARMSEALEQGAPELPKELPDFMAAARAVPRPMAPPAANEDMAATAQALRDALKPMTPQDYHLMHGTAPDKQAIRDHRIDRVKQLVQTHGRHPTGGLVLRYAEKLLILGTARKSLLADSTVYMYAGEVASAFADLGDRLPLTWGELPAEGLQELYQAMASTKSSERLPELLRYFHTFLVDCGSTAFPIAIDAPRRTAAVEVNLVTVRDYLAAHLLLERALKAHSENAELAWWLNAARVTMILMRRCDLRIGEAVGLLHGDLTLHGEVVIACIEDNRFGSLKTPNARRVVVLDEGATDAEREILARWHRQARLKNKTKHPERSSPLLPNRPWDGTTVDRNILIAIISMALQAVTGNKDARPHWLRHAAASYGLMRAMGIPLDDPFDPAHIPPLCRRSDILQLKARVGHGWIFTTLATYIHTLPLVLRVAQARAYCYRDDDLERVAGLNPGHVRQKRADLNARGRSALELIASIMNMRRYKPKLSAREDPPPSCDG